jgi:hypothetical protein
LPGKSTPFFRDKTREGTRRYKTGNKNREKGKKVRNESEESTKINRQRKKTTITMERGGRRADECRQSVTSAGKVGKIEKLCGAKESSECSVSSVLF